MNFSFWWQYMDMVAILLQYVHPSSARSIWDLHLYSFSQMLPYFKQYDHLNYARWGPVYLAEMHQLPEPILSEFQRGNFVIRRAHKFNQVYPDHAMEWINSTGKKEVASSASQRRHQQCADGHSPLTWGLIFQNKLMLNVQSVSHRHSQRSNENYDKWGTMMTRILYFRLYRDSVCSRLPLSQVCCRTLQQKTLQQSQFKIPFFVHRSLICTGQVDCGWAMC